MCAFKKNPFEAAGLPLKELISFKSVCQLSKDYWLRRVLHQQVEEFVMLTDDRLSLFTGDEEDISDEWPTHKVTQFT